MRYFLFILAVVLTLCVSCSQEGFLDQTETTDLDEATVFSDSTYTTGFLTDIYTAIGFSSEPSRFGGFSGTTGGLQTASDEAEPRVSPDITTDLQFITGTLNAVTVSDRPWGLCYTYIRKANKFLKHLPETPLSQTRKTRFAAEARFLRAWYYAILLKHYGGVPIVGDTIYAPDDEISAERNTYAEVVNYIVSEVDAAAEDLTIKPINREYGRIGAGACMALKSRVLLYAASPLHNGTDYEAPFNELLGYPSYDINRWQLAMNAALALIETNAYELYVDNNPEPGFGFYAIFNANSGTGDVRASAAQITVGTILERMSGGGAGFEQLFNPPSRGGSGGGGYPYQELVASFGMNNGMPIGDQNPLYDAQNPYQNRDPRFYNTIIYDQSQLRNNSNNLEPVNIYLGSFNGIPAGQDAVRSGTPTGYYINKFRNRNISGNSGITTSQERPLIRYAEILLNYAEARNEFSGPDETVYQALELIRERAGLNPFQLERTLTQEEMRTLIRSERQVEFAIEGHRFWDVRRWKIASQTENRMMTGLEVFRDGNSVEYRPFNVRKHVFREAQYFWPIPYDEIAKSPELLQNPLY